MNERTRKEENIAKLFELKKKYHLDPEILDSERVLISQYEVRIKIKDKLDKSKSIFFIFNNLILIIKEKPAKPGEYEFFFQAPLPQAVINDVENQCHFQLVWTLPLSPLPLLPSFISFPYPSLPLTFVFLSFPSTTLLYFLGLPPPSLVPFPSSHSSLFLLLFQGYSAITSPLVASHPTVLVSPIFSFIHVLPPFSSFLFLCSPIFAYPCLSSSLQPTCFSPSLPLPSLLVPSPTNISFKTIKSRNRNQ